jgi:hypothetical protein
MSTPTVPNSGFPRGAPASGPRSARLPVTRDLTLAYASTLIIALLVALACVAGLSYATTLYPTQEMRLLKLPTDLFTLVVGLPILLGSLWLARRGRLLGLLCWPGALLYVLYIYLSYVIGVPIKAPFVVYLALIPLSAYTLIGVVASIDAAAVRGRLAGAVPQRAAGAILVGMAVLFTLINLGAIVATLTGPAADDLLELPVWIADSAVIAPAWLVGGLLLFQRKPLGYVAGTGLLLLGGMLFVGAVLALAFPAFYRAEPLDVPAILFVLVAGLICFVPFALFARAAWKADRDPSA